MGRLAGFSYIELIRRLRLLGFEFERSAAGSHEIWYNPRTDKFATVARHTGDIPEGTLSSILKRGGISVAEFLRAK